MADDFIPLNQSTPIRGSPRWQQGKHQNQKRFERNYHNNRYLNGNRRSGYNNSWGNSSRNSSFGSENSSYGQDKNNIDAYLHPSMLQDPWANLRQQSKE